MFLAKTGTKFSCKYLKNAKYFPDDKGCRDVYTITLTKGKREYVFTFGQSIANTGLKEPTAYDVLSTITKNNPGTFDDFCSEYGYDTDSRTAERVYNAVREEWLNVKALFTDDEIATLQEIQ